MTAKKTKPPVAQEITQIAPQAISGKSSAVVEEDSLFSELDSDDISPTRPDDGIPPLDTGLTLSEKQEFVALLNEYLPLKDRAYQLSRLAMYTDTKRAAVGLRAIQEINAITGVSSSAPSEATPMFALPPDTKVSVTITKVVK